MSLILGTHGEVCLNPCERDRGRTSLPAAVYLSREANAISLLPLYDDFSTCIVAVTGNGSNSCRSHDRTSRITMAEWGRAQS
jgi:hypothetical protein